MSIFDDTEDEDIIQYLLNNVEDCDIPALIQAWYDIFMEILLLISSLVKSFTVLEKLLILII